MRDFKIRNPNSKIIDNKEEIKISFSHPRDNNSSTRQEYLQRQIKNFPMQHQQMS